MTARLAINSVRHESYDNFETGPGALSEHAEPHRAPYLYVLLTVRMSANLK